MEELLVLLLCGVEVRLRGSAVRAIHGDLQNGDGWLKPRQPATRSYLAKPNLATASGGDAQTGPGALSLF